MIQMHPYIQQLLSTLVKLIDYNDKQFEVFVGFFIILDIYPKHLREKGRSQPKRNRWAQA